MLNNLLNEYYLSIFGLQIYYFSLIEKKKALFFVLNPLLFLSLVPNNDLIRFFKTYRKDTNSLNINKKEIRILHNQK